MEITEEMIDWEKYLADNEDIELCPPLNVWGTICERLSNDPDQINEEFALYLTDEAKQQVVKEYGPEYVELYYVDYRDDLSDRHHVPLLEKCVQTNSLMPLSETVYDWWDYPEQYYLDEIKNAMERDGLGELFDALYDDFKEWLWDHDKSDPVEGLLNNTGSLTFFYDLGVEIESWPEPAFFGPTSRGESFNMSYYKVRRTLRIAKDSPNAKIVESLVDNQTRSGNLRLYFAMPLQEVISEGLYDPKSKDFKTLRIKGDCYVGIANPTSGASWFEEFKGLDFEIPFDRENLHLSETDHYSMEDICGLYRNWAEDSGAPEFSMESSKSRRKINKSTVNALVSQQEQYEKVFKAGGCTFGDMDSSRHRDVYYDNNIPCGCHCPHCGTFWVD